jgi:hypothetical protein
MYGAAYSLKTASDSYSLVIDLGGAQIVFAFDRARMLEGAPATFLRTSPPKTRSAPKH